MLTEKEIRDILEEAERLYPVEKEDGTGWDALFKGLGREAHIAAVTAERERAKELEDTLAHIMTRPGDWDEVKQLARRALANYRHPNMDKPVKTID